MKRKFFSVFCLMCFCIVIGSNKITTPTDCLEETFDAMDEMDDMGYSDLAASCMGNYVLAACQGWPVTIEEAETCFDL